MNINAVKVFENSKFVVYSIECRDYKVDTLIKFDRVNNHWSTTKNIVPSRVAMAVKFKIVRHYTNKGEYPLTISWSS